ncbi:MAG: type 4a pilus biogenesis protein PilO [Balneola sp.]
MSTGNVHIWKMVSALLVVLFLAATLFGLLPFVVTVFEKQQVLSSQNEQIELMGNWKVQLIDLEEKQEELEDRFSEMVVRLIDKDEFSTIIEQLFIEAGLSSVSIRRVQPGENKINQDYQSKEISLEILGLYHGIARFVNKVEQNGLMIEVKSLEINTVDQSENLEGIIQLAVTLRGS